MRVSMEMEAEDSIQGGGVYVSSLALQTTCALDL